MGKENMVYTYILWNIIHPYNEILSSVAKRIKLEDVILKRNKSGIERQI
jgi:hypothetical protein